MEGEPYVMAARMAAASRLSAADVKVLTEAPVISSIHL